MPDVVIVNPFLHPDIIVHLRDDQEIVEDRVTVGAFHEMRLGAGAYTATAFQQLEWNALVVDAIGDDTFGQYTVREMESAGLTTAFLTRYAGAHMFVLSVADARSLGGTMISSCPPAWQRPADEVVAAIHSAPDADAYYVWSWFWSYANAQLSEIDTPGLMRTIRSQGRLVALDPNWKPPGTPPPLEVDALVESLPSVDILKLNRRDAEVILGESDPRTTVSELLGRGPALVVLTLGADGCVVGSAGRIHHLPPAEGSPSDTTGAGDMFGGHLVADYAAHADPLHAAAIATARTEAFLNPDLDIPVDTRVASIVERSRPI